MKNPNMEVLKEFAVKGHDDEDRAEGLLQAFAPFIQRAESDKYPLATSDEIRESQVRKIISGVIGREIDRVIFISLRYALTDPPRESWMEDKVYDNYRKAVKDAKSSILKGNFGRCVSRRFSEDLRAGPLREILTNASPWVTEKSKEVLRRSIKDDLRKAIRNITIRTDLGHDTDEDMVRSVLFGLRLFLVAITAGFLQTAQFNVLPLLELLEHALPLGEKAGEKGTYIVLVA